MNRKFVVAAAGCVAALMFSGVPAWSVGQDSSSNKFAGAVTERIAGKDRVDTNMKVLKEKFPGLSKPYHAFLARADLGFDALSASPLTFKGPVILVDTHANPRTVTAEQLDPLGVKEVTIVGGPGAMPDRFVNGLGVKVRERIWGKDRYGTNLAVAKQAFPDPETIFMIRGNGAGDGEAAMAASLTKYGPVLFVGPRGCNSEQKAWIESNPNATVSIIGNAPDYPAPARQRRISRVGFAQTAEQVSALVAKQTFPSGNPKMYIARSDTLADAIAAANIIYDGPVVLVNPSGFPSDALLAAKDLRATTVIALGGVAAVPESVLAVFRPGGQSAKARGQSPQNMQQVGLEEAIARGDAQRIDGKAASSEELRYEDTKSWIVAKNPGWKKDQAIFERIADLGIQLSWQNERGAAPVHNPALDLLVAKGEGTAGMGMMVWKKSHAYSPINVNNWEAEGAGQPYDFGRILPGDIAQTAQGNFLVTRISYGRNVEVREEYGEGTQAHTRGIFKTVVACFKIEGKSVTTGVEQMIDASGIMKVQRPDGYTSGADYFTHPL
ncbi:cell wall-binding repeat-containing protein [Mobiluncus curtisii]|uniref:cell wall-binding repeat-containing protein n=1 Tax=Mobiluncus curtisii TaxID=2051 RepID=UPI00146FF437|nr:cell wall-binding repeat-containing protein [Mobiluncus curtisii]NMW43693.1 cell wall-binding repeat-containing protein [Mobiluncus curtisii]NMX05567.1 cell wall-binding repeat-containing protein [Mobiluncus curtisii]